MPNPRPVTVDSITVNRPVSASLRVYYADGSDKPAAPEDLAQFGYYPVFEDRSWADIEVDLGGGVSIHTAATRLATLATIVNVKVRTMFNGTALTVSPGHPADEVVAAYHEFRRVAEAERNQEGR